MADKGARAEPIQREWLAICDEKESDAWTTFNAKPLLGGALFGQSPVAAADARSVRTSANCTRPCQR
jgi:hypothetical protein